MYKRQDKENKMLTGTKSKSIIHSGFIAQEVNDLVKKSGTSFSGVDVPKNNSDRYGLRYSLFVVPLVKAIQEQQVLLEIEKSKVAVLEEKFNKILKEVNVLKLNIQKQKDLL